MSNEDDVSRVCQSLFADLKAEAEVCFRYAGAERIETRWRDASPNDDKVALAASKTGGEGGFSATDANTWTLTYTGENKQSIHTTARIESSKTVDDKLYKKEYTLNIEKTVDPEYPTSFWATSTPEDNGTSIIKKDGKYYEVHTFITSGTLSIDSVPDAGLTAQVLVVAGGGGAGGAVYPSSGAILDPQNFLTAKSKKSKKFSFKLLKT